MAQDYDVAVSQCEEFPTMGLLDPVRMNIIDKLREIGVGQVLSLPQLVVVGDQSSGKSSVLEAITQISFPREAGTCTRFATNITLHRSPRTSAKVSIMPGRSCESHKKADLKEFKKVDIDIHDEKQFLDILQEASRLMGVLGPNEKPEEGKKSFSDDVLKIDLNGPDLENLSIIDVPGIFRNTSTNTTEGEMQLVRDMVTGYIKEHNTIILAVVSAAADIETQEILQLAKKADPKGRRTLGVLTKPDLMDKGDRKRVIELLQGKTSQLALGYHVVRNRGQEELDDKTSPTSRDETERIFLATSPWKDVDEDRAGVVSLKARLQHLLTEIIRREFPKIKAQMGKKLSAAKQELAGMGVDRHTTDQQRRFLVEIAMKFQKIRDDAMATVYHRHEILEDNESLRLPTLVAKRSDLFLKDIKSKGHFVQFEKSAEDSDDEDYEADKDGKHDEADKDEVDGEDEEDEEDEEDDEDYEAGKNQEVNSEADEADKDMPAVNDATEDVEDLDWKADAIQIHSLDGLKARKFFPELDDILVASKSGSKYSQKSIKKWIGKEYRAARGYGLEIMNPSILPLLWQMQCHNWDLIARDYIYDIIIYVHRFTFLILKHVCSDEKTFIGLMNHLQEEHLRCYNRSIEQVEFILKVERFGTLITKTDDFARTLEKLRIERNQKVMKVLVNGADSGTGIDTNGNPQESVIERVVSVPSQQSNIEHAIDDLHAALMVYYKVARKRFVDIVITQAADYLLLTGSESPLSILTAPFIASLSEDQLENIAGEDKASKTKRGFLKGRIAALEEGQKVIRG